MPPQTAADRVSSSGEAGVPSALTRNGNVATRRGAFRNIRRWASVGEGEGEGEGEDEGEDGGGQAVMECRPTELDTMPLDADDWVDTLQSLKNCVQHHVQEEEGEIFSKARTVLGDELLEAMGDRFRRAKDEEPH